MSDHGYCYSCSENHGGFCMMNQTKLPVSGICIGDSFLGNEAEDQDNSDIDEMDARDLFGQSEEVHTVPPVCIDEPNEWTIQFGEYIRRGDININMGQVESAQTFFTAANAIANSGLMRGYIKLNERK